MSVEVAIPTRTACPRCHAVFRGGFQRCPRDGAVLEAGDGDPLVGTVLAERYQIESLIGEGGLGRVYRARHVRMSRRFAVKVPFGELAYDAKVRDRFLLEAEATSRLQHRNVIGVVDVGESAQGLLYMAMDLAEGTSLADVIARDAPLDAPRVRAIATQIAEGLGHAHERGLVHRDLKPENVILVPEEGGERVCLVDFGIAIVRGEEGAARGRLTTDGMVLGTPHYMAPEQACGLPLDHRTDLFALGLLIYEMLAGVLPFEGTPIEVAHANLGTPPPPIARRVPGLVVDPQLEALAFRLMEKRPEQRPQLAAEVVAALAAPSAPAAALDEGDELSARPAPPPDATPTQHTPVHEARPRRLVRWLVLALALALVGLATVLLVRPSGGAAPSTAADAGPAVAVARSPDAGVVAPAVVADAGAIAVDAAPAAASPSTPTPRPRGTRRRPVEAPTSAGGAVAPHGAAAPAPDPSEPPSKASLTALYQQVGQQLNKVIASKGDTATAQWTQDYSAIPYLEAVRKPELRAEAMKRLRELQRAMSR